MKSEFRNKVASFALSLQNTYKEEESRDDFQKLELNNETLTEDFTAMIYALFFIYKNITGDDTDILGFTHILNRLVVQHVMEEEED